MTPFDTWDCYYFWSNLSLTILIKMLLIKKQVTLFFSLLKMNKQLCQMSLFLCLSNISLERWKKGIKKYQKSCQKRWKERWPYMVFCRRGAQTFSTLWTKEWSLLNFCWLFTINHRFSLSSWILLIFWNHKKEFENPKTLSWR